MKLTLRPWHFILLLPLLGLAVWLGQRSAQEREDPAELLSALQVDAVPGLPSVEAAGAVARTPIETYDADGLYEFINGAADGYLAHGFELCEAAVYTMPLEGDATVEIQAELHRFATPQGAVARVAAERPGAAEEIAGMDAAVSDGFVLLATAGREMLKLTSLSFDHPAGPALEQLASAWLQTATP